MKGGPADKGLADKGLADKGLADGGPTAAGTEHRIDTSFLARLDKYTLPLRKRVTGVQPGSHLSTRQGAGLDLVEHRKYSQGDSLKNIDWNLYARMEKLYVRRLEADKTMNLVVLLDASSSMLFPNKGPNKFEYAATIALGLSYIVMRYNDRYTIIPFTDRAEYTESRKGRADFLRTLDRLSGISVSGPTKLADCAYSVYPRIKSKSMLIIISDFLDEPDSIRYAVRRLSRHDPVLICLYDDSESSLPESVDGSIKFIDSETDEEINISVGPKFRKEYASEYARHITELEKIAYDFKVPYFRVDIKARPFDTVLKIIGEV